MLGISASSVKRLLCGHGCILSSICSFSLCLPAACCLSYLRWHYHRVLSSFVPQFSGFSKSDLQAEPYMLFFFLFFSRIPCLLILFIFSCRIYAFHKSSLHSNVTSGTPVLTTPRFCQVWHWFWHLLVGPSRLSCNFWAQIVVNDPWWYGGHGQQDPWSYHGQSRQWQLWLIGPAPSLWASALLPCVCCRVSRIFWNEWFWPFPPSQPARLCG